MPKYSRTAKYEDLRNRLQNDAEADVSTRDLNQYEQRLHQINSSNFQKPEEASEDSAAKHDPIHARRSQYLNQETQQPEKQEEAAPAASMLKENENYTSAFNNEFLNEYIKEVKQYNKDHGTSMSTNTDMDILRSLQQGQSSEKKVSKPYPDEKQEKKDHSDASTADIPFYKGANEYAGDFEDDENRPPLSDTRTMTKEDIAAEVQNLIRGQQGNASGADTGSITAAVKTAVQNDTPETKAPARDFDRTARQQLLNETTQMRAQLDDYEDNLTEVNDKVRHTNRVLNVVLIVLIIALSVVLAVVIYWVLSSRGIIG